MDDLMIHAAIAIAMILIPVLIWFLRLRPKVGRKHVPLILSALLGSVCFLFPLDIGFSSVEMFVILMGIFVLMLVVHWIIWICAAIRKQTLSLPMLLMPGLSVLACGAFSGHVLAILGAAVYLVCVFRTRYAVN